MFSKIQNIAKISVLAIGLPVLSFAQSIRANANLTVNPVFTPSAPVIDGLLDDYCWRATTILGIVNPNALLGSGAFPQSIAQPNNVNDNGTTGPPPASPPASIYTGRSATFSLVWDQDNLYFAAKVVAPDIANSTTTFAGEGIELFFNNGNGTSSLIPGGTNFPQRYNPSKDGQQVFDYGPTNALTSKFLVAGDGFRNAGGLAVTNFNAAALKTSDGYTMEGRISWKDINVEFINILTGQYNTADVDKMPSKNRIPFRFDISNNIGSSTPGGRLGQFMWNQCCWNSNWTASQDFGVMKLIGEPGTVTVEGINITIPGSGMNPIATPATTLQLKAIVAPEAANQNVRWNLIGNTIATGEPIVSISPNGIVSPFNDGVVTITATTIALPTTTSFIVITITGQRKPTSITMAGANIETNWGSSVITSTILPDGSPQAITYSLNEVSKNYATINSLTGVVRSKATTTSFVVTVIGTSVANKTLTGTYGLSILKQSPVSCFTVNAYSNIVQCRTLSNFTLGNNGVGFATGQRLGLVMDYVDYYNTTIVGAIPTDLYTIESTLTGGSFVEKTVNGYELVLNGNSSRGTITGTYLYNATPRVITVRIDRNSATTCTGMPIPFMDVRNTTLAGGCSLVSILGINETSSEVAKVSVYPNPANESVTVAADGLVSVVVYNLIGAQVAAVAASANEAKINTSGLTSGVYIVTAKFKNGRTTSHKLAIE